MKERLVTFVAFVIAALAPTLASAATDKVAVAIGQRGLWDTLVIYQGIEEGLFAEENLEVDVTWTKGGAETLQAVTTRSVDMGFVNGMLGVLGAYRRGAPVRIIGAQMTGANDLFWYARADSDLESFADAAGKRIGYSRPGSSSQLVLLALLDNARVQAKPISSGGIPDNRIQVMSGQLDVGWSVPPFNLDLVKKGELKIVAKGSDIPALADQTVRTNISNTRFLTERRDVAKRFMRAYMRAVDWMYQNQEAAIKRFAEFNNLDMDIAREAAAFYPKKTLLSVPVKGLERTMKEAIEHGALRESLTANEIEELIDYVHDPR
ncbi:ABC transporter substrate-binding protein [Pseudomonas sp. SST3]|jgi:NitT/TauT family transport system substrate-binding protein|uniref:ABC transporter substrate-binding protein n=1 Tax=Pseudomonas sp. SST3 TaxID=2267882 RepID=UPI000DF9C004|nr:ABC transporter substrate-binding protein [Pseudomonas sp. SST3]NKQ12819.1 ABC transporter substrate-binding protein [Pseudomonas sp. SST3]